jgi:hypothetical protein
MRTMNSNRKNFLYQAKRHMLALTASLLLIPALPSGLHAEAPSAPAYVDLDAVQLDQLVAPIALDPDSLVAQILTASTYPDQVASADAWLNQNMGLPPDQRATAANNMSWDPAVKGLTEFPSTLDSLAKNTAWTAQLGNAYYNQPGDVMNAIQAMRLQAQQANTLVTTAQQRVVVEEGVIAIVPVNPAVIYVPYYNPWRIWGALFVAYPGFVVLPPPTGVITAVGLAFDPPVAVGVYAGVDWGFSAWAPAWDGGTVLFGGNTYVSNSVTVVNHGYFGGRDRGVFEHGGRGVPGGYRACAHRGAAREAAAHRGFDGRGRYADGRGRYGDGRGGHYGEGHLAANHGSAYGNHGAAYGNRGAANHGATNHGTPAANHGTAAANHGTAAGNRGTASPSRGTSAANHGTSSASHGTATANRGSASSNRGTSAANHGATANRGTTSANRSTSSASHGTSSANRGASTANHATPAANRGASSANRGTASANRGASTANRGTSTASRGTSSASRAAASHGASTASANRGASASHAASAGHSSGGKGKGK